MLKIRTYLFIFLLFSSIVLYYPVAILISIFINKKKSYYVMTAWGRFSLILIKYILGISYLVKNPQYIPKKANVILSKHQSALDIFVLLTIFDPQTWVFKRELLSIPFFGWALRVTDPIAINRSDGRHAITAVINSGIKKIKDGYFVVMYPEGTRVEIGKKGRYKGGGVLLAQKAEVDITPVALNTGLFWKKGKGLQKTGIIDIVIGKPIPTLNRDTSDILQEVSEWIENHTDEIIK